MASRKPISQAAAIPFRSSELGPLEVLLVSRTGGGWGFPKGGIKKRQSPRETATHETLEEAGVLGRLLEAPLGRFSYRKRGKPHQVTVYALEVERVLARWSEEDRRLRVWVPVTEAARFLDQDELTPLLIRLRHRVLTGAAAAARLAA